MVICQKPLNSSYHKAILKVGENRLAFTSDNYIATKTEPVKITVNKSLSDLGLKTQELALQIVERCPETQF